MRLPVLGLLLFPTVVFATDLTVENAMVPMAPPMAKVHAAYMTLTNSGDSAKALIGVSAQGYAMAHLHMSDEKDGVSTMTAVDQIEIAAGQTIKFEHGGLHIMLMRPDAPTVEGQFVNLDLLFADGSSQPISVPVVPLKTLHGSHGS